MDCGFFFIIACRLFAVFCRSLGASGNTANAAGIGVKCNLEIVNSKTIHMIAPIYTIDDLLFTIFLYYKFF